MNKEQKYHFRLICGTMFESDKAMISEIIMALKNGTRLLRERELDFYFNPEHITCIRKAKKSGGS